MFAALFSAIAAGGSLIVDKIALSRKGTPLSIFIPLVFVFLFLFTIIFAPFYGFVDWQIALLPNILFLTLLMVVIAIAWNVLYYQSLQKESAHQHEMIVMTGPLITIVMAAVFFQEEFDMTVFVLSLAASLALLFARSEKHHFNFDKTSYNLFLAVVLMSVESLIIRELLYTYAPVSLYALRTFFIAGFFLLYYRPKYKQATTSQWSLIIASSAIGVAQMISRFYAFDELGIIFTTLVSTLAPIIVFLASWEILHERIRPRVVLASVLILICVTLATVLTATS